MLFYTNIVKITRYTYMYVNCISMYLSIIFVCIYELLKTDK